MNQKGALMIALVIHVVIIAIVLRTARANAGTSGSGTIEGAAAHPTLGGMPMRVGRIPNPLQVDDEAYKGIDAAVVHVLAPDSVMRTAKDGSTTLMIRPGSWVLVRVTKAGFKPVTLRISGNSPPAPRTVIRLFPPNDSLPPQ